ncbi:MAG: type III-B CRISPR module RAMP protein Cmr4 [Sulfurovum sp.]|nr:type III-B CRISPR module RAMP protein Cmr4 [Sulfurovum sp.]
MYTRLFEATLYKITAVSNLHVGNGEANFSVLDKQVQRDVISNYPQINASSLKGALREYMTFVKFKNEEGKDSFRPLVSTIFGSEPTQGDDKAHQGYMNFHDAKLLSLPVRTNKVPFLRATSKEVLREYQAYCKNFAIECDLDIDNLEIGHELDETVVAEEWQYNKSINLNGLKELIGENIILMKDEHFRTLAKELPFVARNYLENGKSENLWYEEIVPRESQFYFALEQPNDNTLAYKLTQEGLDTNTLKQTKKDKVVPEYFGEFNTALNQAELFIGANTTVGYGKCKIMQLDTTIAEYKEAQDEPKKD